MFMLAYYYTIQVSISQSHDKKVITLHGAITKNEIIFMAPDRNILIDHRKRSLRVKVIENKNPK
jgi:uncharacterized protein YbcI